jgi:hypothetical protein
MQSLAQFNQFIVYKLVPSRTRIGKTDKLPIDWQTGKMPLEGSGASSIWTSLEKATAAAQWAGPNHGIGFSFADSDPYFFLDIDNCLEPSGNWSALAQHLCAAFPGAYVEVSQSGKGLHIIGRGTPPEHGCKNVPCSLELYHKDRFCALTGIGAMGDANTDMSYVLPWLVDNYFKPGAGGDGAAVAWSDEPDPEWRGPTDDDKLIERALRSKSSASAFGNRASFADLWYADVEALARAYPDPEREYDASSADAALAQHLAFWTGNNCERIYNLMQRSALKRDKWEREDYLKRRTIPGAVSRQTEVLQDKALTIEYDTPDGTLTASPQHVQGTTYADIDSQIRMFAGCVYITDQHKILMPGGSMLKPDQFRVAFGGFSFPMDPGNERISRNAWECFTESQAFRAPRAESSCFRPDLAPGSIIKVDGQLRANTYWPVITPRREGDPQPFLDHLVKILPEKRDRDIMLAYMAACVQHKGSKFQWAPLLQGVEGNGKSLLTRCVAFAISERYTHFPKASQIAKHFNGWMHGRLFIGVEDVYIPFSQQDVLEELKPMITGERLEIERKGVDQVTLEVCCNFIMNCNDKGAIRKTKNDRRIAPFYTAQQDKDDLVRDGMTDGYFTRLYSWLRNAGGYEIVNELLHTYNIPPELNPANGHIAPLTSSTSEALAYGLGRVEQEILEAMEREDVGFRGGWVSSMAIDRLLERIGSSRSIPLNKRRDIMLNLGYDYHPGLVGGRVNNSVLPDGGKPRLFIAKNSPLQSIVNPADIARMYATAQNIG